MVPDWRIIKRNSNGVVVSNDTIRGVDIIIDTDDELEWIPDPDNSVLRVGPVDSTDNQSSYQCIFTILSGILVSAVGTLMVLGEMMGIYKLCTCHIMIKSYWLNFMYIPVLHCSYE